MQIKRLTEKKSRINSEVTQVMAELQAIRNEQKERENEISVFQKEIDLCYFTRSRAARLLNELTGEMQKWRVSEEVSRDNLTRLEGDCLMAAAMVCYLSPFT